MNKHISPLPPSQVPGLATLLGTGAGQAGIKSLVGGAAKKGLGGVLGKVVGGALTKNPIAMGIGAVAGGVGGFLNARQEARAAGEKLTFKDAIDDIALGAGKGALSPISAGVGLVREGIETQQQNKELEREAIAENAMQNSSINQNPVFDPLAAATMKGLFKKQ